MCLQSHPCPSSSLVKVRQRGYEAGHDDHGARLGIPATCPRRSLDDEAGRTLSPRAVRIGMRILSRSPVFEALPPEELERVAGRSVFRRLRRGEALTRHGERVQWLIVIGEGRLKATMPSPGTGTEFLLGTFIAGDVIGEIGLFENVPRVGTHAAVIETDVLLVPKLELLALIDRRPVVATRLLEAVARKLRLAMELGLALHSLGLPGRFYGRLLDLARTCSRRDGGGDPDRARSFAEGTRRFDRRLPRSAEQARDRLEAFGADRLRTGIRRDPGSGEARRGREAARPPGQHPRSAGHAARRSFGRRRANRRSSLAPAHRTGKLFPVRSPP